MKTYEVTVPPPEYLPSLGYGPMDANPVLIAMVLSLCQPEFIVRVGELDRKYGFGNVPFEAVQFMPKAVQVACGHGETDPADLVLRISRVWWLLRGGK